MATFLNSANFSGKNGTHFSANLYYDYSQSVENNRTTITYYLYFQSKDGYSGSGSTVTGYINGTSVGTTTSVGVNEEKYLGQITVYVNHNSDGTFPSTSYSAMIDTPWTLGDASISGNLTGLPTIPRASTPQLSSNNFNIGSSVTLTTNRKSTSFTHTVVLTFGSYTKTYTNVGDSQVINTSQFASNMYAQMPNAKSKTGTITTTTYNGSTQIGSASSLTFTANAVEGNVNPQITALTYTVDSTTSSLANSTTFIKGVTNTTIKVTANRRMSATLTKVFLWYYNGTNKVVLSSQNVNADGIYTFTINGISVSKVYGGATDTRGYTTYETNRSAPTTFKDYITLTADTNANIRRIVQTEPNVRINSFTGNYWNKSFGTQSNTLTIKWRYKETTASSYSAEYTIPASSISISNNKYTISNYTLTNGSTTELFNYQKSYHVQISVTDKIGTKSVVYTITAGQPNFAVFPSASLVNSKRILTTDDTMVLSNQLPSNGVWQKICNVVLKTHAQGEFYHIRLYIGHGNNGNPSQNAFIDLIGQKAWTGNNDGRAGWFAELHPMNSVISTNNIIVKIIANSALNYDIWLYTSFGYCRVSYFNLNNENNVTVTKKFELQTAEPTGTACDLLLQTISDYYTTSEKRIGRWIDGKPLYRKVIDIGNLPNATTKTVNTGLASNVIVTKMQGLCYGSGVVFPLPYVSVGGLNTCIAIWLSNNYGTLNIQTGYDRSALKGYVTIEYAVT